MTATLEEQWHYICNVQCFCLFFSITQIYARVVSHQSYFDGSAGFSDRSQFRSRCGIIIRALCFLWRVSHDSFRKKETFPRASFANKQWNIKWYRHYLLRLHVSKIRSWSKKLLINVMKNVIEKHWQDKAKAEAKAWRDSINK